MPFKRVAINQGRQPRALVNGAWCGVAWISLSLAGSRKWTSRGAEVAAQALYGAWRLSMMRWEALL